MAIVNLITNYTKIIELQDNIYSNYVLSKKIGIKRDVFESWNSWYSYNNQWYFFKNFTCDKYESLEFKLINELIGEELSKYLNIDVIHYEIAKLGNIYGLASLSFFKQKNKYYFSKDINIYPNHVNMKNIRLLKYECKNDSNYIELINEIYKLTALDIYMNQTDRNYSNYQFRRENGYLHLAPLYDFEESFVEPFKYYYDSDLLGISFENINNYPRLKQYIDMLLDIDINKILLNIEKERGIVISKKYKDYYFEYIKDRKCLLKSFK